MNYSSSYAQIYSVHIPLKANKKCRTKTLLLEVALKKANEKEKDKLFKHVLLGFDEPTEYPLA